MKKSKLRDIQFLLGKKKLVIHMISVIKFLI